MILLFFYYLYCLAVILLLGAEINSWVAGYRETRFNLPGMPRALESPTEAQPTDGQPKGGL